MTTIALYMDEDSMRHSVVRALRARGVDVTTARTFTAFIWNILPKAKAMGE